MNSRDRFSTTCSHRPPDRPPIDLGATSLTAMSAGCQKALREFLGFSGLPAPTNSGVDERILEWAGCDFRGVGSIVGLPSPHTRRLPDGRAVDCWGVCREQVGRYWEITHSPLHGASREDLRTFAWPEPRIDEGLLANWQAAAKRLRAAGRYVVIAEHPVFGLLELGCWMCGYDDFLMRLAGDTDFVKAFFARTFEIQMAVVEAYYTALGPYIDLTTSGDDFGMQTGPLLAPAVFAELVAPTFSARVARTKALANCLYWHHSCGSVTALLDQLIGCGVDILNPVQTSAVGMEPAELKGRFGDRIVFWGGVDVQQVLPQATPAEVRAYVGGLLSTLGRSGGYVVAPAHNMQDDVPPENIAAWVETARCGTGG